MVDVVLLLYLPQRFGTKCVGWRFNSSRRLQLFPLFYQLVTAKSSISGQRLSCADVSKFFPLACFFGGFDAAHTQVHFSLHSPLDAIGEGEALRTPRCEACPPMPPPPPPGGCLPSVDPISS